MAFFCVVAELVEATMDLTHETTQSFVRWKSNSVDKTWFKTVLSTESHVWPEILTDYDATGHQETLINV